VKLRSTQTLVILGGIIVMLGTPILGLYGVPVEGALAGQAGIMVLLLAAVFPNKRRR
jgi:hypothetical protein